MEETTRRFSRRGLITTLIALTLAVLMAVLTPISAYAAGEEKGAYIKETIMITAKDQTEAESKLAGLNKDAKEKYYLFTTPIYDRGGVQTYLAYTTTDNKLNAAKAIKAMYTKGGWSYHEYDEYLKQKKDEATYLAQDLYKAVQEYATNLSAKKPNAVYAQGLLNYFKCDGGQFLSDFFVEQARKNSFETAKEEMLTFTMQANKDILVSVECALMVACADSYKGNGDPNDVNFLTGMQSSSFLEQLPGFLTGDEYKDFDIYVDELLASLPNVQEDIRFYLTSGFVFDDDLQRMMAEQEALIIENADDGSKNPDQRYIEERDTLRDQAASDKNELGLSEKEQAAAKKLKAFDLYFKTLSPENQNHYNNGKIFYDALYNCKYTGYRVGGEDEYDCLLDLIMLHEGSEISKYKKTDFYPLIQKLSPGQRALLKTGLSHLLSTVLVPRELMENSLDAMIDTINKRADNENEKIKKGNAVSVYHGVDRTLFQKDQGIAMTSEAIAAELREPLDHVVSDNDKAQAICDIIAIAAGGVAAASMIAAAGFATALYTAAAAKLSAAFAAVGETVGVWVPQSFTFLGYSCSAAVQNLGFGAGYLTSIQVGSASGISTELVGGGAAASATNATWGSCLGAFLKMGLGIAMKWITITAIGIIIIALATKYLWPIISPEDDAPYIDIPRVMCSYEDIFGQTVKANDKPVKDYIYYYGVKNPLLTKEDSDRASAAKDEKGNVTTNIMKFKIGDVCNWSLKGLSRQWCALYVSTDEKSGNPIKADSLTVLENPNEFSNHPELIPVKVFHEPSAWDFHSLYGVTVNRTQTPRYLAYQCDNSTTPEQTASVFSDLTLWGGIVAGLVLGGGIGTLVTYLVSRNRKKKAAVAE